MYLNTCPEGYISSFTIANNYQLVEGFSVMRSLANDVQKAGDSTVLLEGFAGCVTPDGSRDELIGFSLRAGLRERSYGGGLESKALVIILTPKHEVDILVSDEYWHDLASTQFLASRNKGYAPLVQGPIDHRIKIAWRLPPDYIRDQRPLYQSGVIRPLAQFEEGHLRLAGVVSQVRNLSRMIS